MEDAMMFVFELQTPLYEEAQATRSDQHRERQVGENRLRGAELASLPHPVLLVLLNREELTAPHNRDRMSDLHQPLLSRRGMTPKDRNGPGALEKQALGSLWIHAVQVGQ
ncbi:unnamed protein product [Rangifer tarandus platyrhynchus]|uniref:Uncharacterized protein n=2 Tax=Rangifer tarandus platyrhynchus TaxID=3082113 RepID=A0ACB0DQE9_RANTA|nr:unnamed protein product [Rangifer tarandus platyrhynchus]CAI9690311.1 unnamed protein product [Rangifer tarandus platyrhynchus]